MNKIGGKIVLWGVIIGMLAFTSIRTIHFLQRTFPPDQQYVAYIALLAFDVGVLAWFYYATKSAEGAAQRAMAYGMILVCAAGVITTTVADMTIVSSQNGLSKLPPDVGTLGLWAAIIVIILNFLAGILVHLADPNHLKQFEMQNAKDVIHATTMHHIRQQAHAIAPHIAAQVSQYWAAQVTAEMTGQIPGAAPIQIAPPQVVQGSATALPQTGEAQPQKGLFGRIKDAVAGNNAQPAQQIPQEHTFTKAQLDEALSKAYDQGIQHAKETQSPLAQPQLDATASQPGRSGNGHKES